MGDINGATEAILQFQLHSRVIRNKVPKIGAFLNPQKRSFLATFSWISLLWEGNSKIAPVTPFILSQLTFQYLHWAYSIDRLGCRGDCYRFWALLILYYCLLCMYMSNIVSFLAYRCRFHTVSRLFAFVVPNQIHCITSNTLLQRSAVLVLVSFTYKLAR